MIRFLITLLLLTAPAPARGIQWLVLPDGTGDAPTIQAAIDSAASGDSVILAAGTFIGSGNRNVSFLGKAITVTSANGPLATVIDCEGAGRGFAFENGEGAASILSGVTIRNGAPGKSGGGVFITGSSPTIKNNFILDNTGDGGGGGIFIIQSSAPTICDNVISGNTGTSGGGIWCGNLSTPVICGNVISMNTAIAMGGGIFLTGFSPASIDGNTITENGAFAGGGIHADTSSPTIERCIIAFNVGGGAMTCGVGAAPQLRCNVVFGNAGGDALCGGDLGDNVFADPLFCGAAGSGNYFLRSISPCSAANHPCGQLVGARGTGCGATPAEPVTWGEMKTKYRRP